MKNRESKMSSSILRSTLINNSKYEIVNVESNGIIQNTSSINISDSEDDSDEDTLHIEETIDIDSESYDHENDANNSNSQQNGCNNHHQTTTTSLKSHIDDNIIKDHPIMVKRAEAYASQKDGKVFVTISERQLNQSLESTVQWANGNKRILPRIKIVCGKCPEKKFPNLVSYEEHKKTHDANQITFNSFIAPQINMIIDEPVEEQFNYQCEFCSENLSSDQLLIDHCARMHPKNVKCQYCEKTFYREKDLHFHMKTHVKRGKGFKCKFCTALFLNISELRKHSKNHDIVNTKVKQYQCDLCEKIFQNLQALLRHKKRFLHKQCEVCLEYFQSDAKLLEHISVHIEKTPKYQETYECEFCKSIFLSTKEIEMHIVKCWRIQCSACNKSFLNKDHLAAHHKVHYKQNHCEFCNQSFLLKSELLSHIDNHTLSLPYECDICFAILSNKHLFNIHLRSHRRKTNFKCDYCIRWFLSQLKLKKHLKTHNHDAYKCNVCTMQFSIVVSLKKHMKNGHREQITLNGETEQPSFLCDICDESFHTKEIISYHMEECHHSIETQCHICDENFMTRKDFIAHVKTHYVQVELDDDDDNDNM